MKEWFVEAERTRGSSALPLPALHACMSFGGKDHVSLSSNKGLRAAQKGHVLSDSYSCPAFYLITVDSKT